MEIHSLVAEIRQSTDIQRNKLKLREQIMGDLMVTHNDGLFKVTPELIAFLSAWDSDELYLEDHYGNPVEVDRAVLLDSCKRRYQKVMNQWHNQYEQLRQVRKI
jgi:hypothetical protein